MNVNTPKYTKLAAGLYRETTNAKTGKITLTPLATVEPISDAQAIRVLKASGNTDSTAFAAIGSLFRSYLTDNNMGGELVIPPDPKAIAKVKRSAVSDFKAWLQNVHGIVKADYKQNRSMAAYVALMAGGARLGVEVPMEGPIPAAPYWKVATDKTGEEAQDAAIKRTFAGLREFIFQGGAVADVRAKLLAEQATQSGDADDYLHRGDLLAILGESDDETSGE